MIKITITDNRIYRMESIRDEMNDLLDEAKDIIASTDDYLIVTKTKKWMDTVKDNIYSKTNIVTMSTTINELWEDWYNYVYTGENDG